MFTDILTVARKELKEILVQRGSLRTGMSNLVIVIGIMGILFPLQNGLDWLTNPFSLWTVIWLPLLMSMGLIADSFAGERERHTLETLLATRLSDRAILFGKITTAVAYTLGLTFTGALLGAVTLNIQYPGAGFYLPFTLLGLLIFTLLGSLLLSGMGVLVSLRADSVRQAYQRMSIGYLVLLLPLTFAPNFLPQETLRQISTWLAGLNMLQAGAVAGTLLLLIDVVLIAISLARFQRARLIAD